MRSLILLATRRCNQSCTYCPVVETGGVDLTPARAAAALSLFVDRFGGGHVKIFGGEPLLVPEVVKTVLETTTERSGVRTVELVTNGIELDRCWIERLAAHPRCTVSLSLDGVPEDHRRHRRPRAGAPDAYDHLQSLLPDLLNLKRLVVTQVIPPATVHRAAANFRHLLSQGFEALRLLPASWQRWRREELVALRSGFAEIARTITARWAEGRRFRLANRFDSDAQPAFAAGLVVDGDARIYPSDCVVGDVPDELRAALCVGTLESPPSPEDLRQAAQRVPRLLRQWQPDEIWRSTLAADGELTRFCHAVRSVERVYRSSVARGSSSESPNREA